MCIWNLLWSSLQNLWMVAWFDRRTPRRMQNLILIGWKWSHDQLCHLKAFYVHWLQNKFGWLILIFPKLVKWDIGQWKLLLSSSDLWASIHLEENKIWHWCYLVIASYLPNTYAATMRSKMFPFSSRGHIFIDQNTEAQRYKSNSTFQHHFHKDFSHPFLSFSIQTTWNIN